MLWQVTGFQPDDDSRKGSQPSPLVTREMNGVTLFLEVCDDRSCLSSLFRAHRHNRRDSGYPIWIAQRPWQRRLDRSRPRRDQQCRNHHRHRMVSAGPRARIADAYRGDADRIPTIQYGILVPILIGGLLIRP